MIIKRWEHIATRQYTPHFRLNEFFCPCGICQNQIIDPALLEKLEELRGRIGFPLSVTSGFRCKRHNDSLPGAKPNSRHLYGQAADVLCLDVGTVEIAQIAYSIGFRGIGVADNFTHLDIREGKFAFWVYNSLDLDIIKREVMGVASGL